MGEGFCLTTSIFTQVKLITNRDFIVLQINLLKVQTFSDGFGLGPPPEQMPTSCRPIPTGRIWSEMVGNGRKWSEMVGNGRKRSELVGIFHFT